jgi:hypothetical protein
MTNDTDVDHRVLHAGLPVIEGEKWGMNIWIRQRVVPPPATSFDQPTATADSSDERGP